MYNTDESISNFFKKSWIVLTDGFILQIAAHFPTKSSLVPISCPNRRRALTLFLSQRTRWLVSYRLPISMRTRQEDLSWKAPTSQQFGMQRCNFVQKTHTLHQLWTGNRLLITLPTLKAEFSEGAICQLCCPTIMC